MNNRRGNLVVVSAPSGSGKTTLVKKLLTTMETVVFSVSFTTRPRRDEERDGIDYHFISEDVFLGKVAAKEFLEWAEVHGKLYGSGRAETETIRSSGNDVLLDVDVQGADQVREACPEAITVFVLAPSFEILEERLRSRSSDPPEVIETRLKAAKKEVDHYQDYDYVLINEDIDRSTETLRSIVLAERAKRPLMESRIGPIVESFKRKP
jgi:guanylate kinase